MTCERRLVFIHIPALVLPVSVAAFVTAHSSKPVTPVISAHTSTDPAVSATLVALVTIWIAALATVIQVLLSLSIKAADTVY